MKYLVLFPLNIIIVIIIAFLLSFLNISDFYDSNSFIDFINISIIIMIYYFGYKFLKNSNLFDIILNIYALQNFGSQKKYKYPLIIGVSGFLIEFIVKGIPLFISGGRDDYTGVVIVHPMSYSLIIVAVAYACTFSKSKDIFITFTVLFVLSILLLSRQMFMISIVIFFITYFIRNTISLVKFIKTFLVLFFIFILFGYIGNIRQQLSGDYQQHYIYVIGGINKFGENFSDSFIWIWLYLVTPVYNLFANINSYNLLKGNCNYNLVYGDCNGDFLSSVFVPNTILKYLNSENFEIDLVVGHLNVGTGYAVAGRLFGMYGISIQIILQIIIFYLGCRFYKNDSKLIFLILFSAFSVFMIFDNLYTKGEFFFCFVVIFMMQYRFKIK